MGRLNFETAVKAETSANARVSGGKLYVYAAGTTTPVTTYSDSALTNAQAHPVVAGSDGVFAQTYVPNGQYKVIVTDADDVTLEEVDNIQQGVERLEADTAEGIITGSTYVYSGEGTVVSENDIIFAREDNLTFKVAASAASDHDATTGGLVKLYLREPLISYKSQAAFRATTETWFFPGLNVKAGDSVLEIAPTGATDNHDVTDGGVKFYVIDAGLGYLGAVDFGLTNELIQDAGTGTGALSGVTQPAIANASFLDGHKGPVFLKSGDYSAENILDLGVGRNKLVLRGAGEFCTRVKIPDGQYLYDSDRNPIALEIDRIGFVGGKGLLRLANTTDFGRGHYRIKNCVIQGFTECGIAILSPDYGRLDIEGNFFWSAGTGGASSDINGIGIAHAGWADNSFIMGNKFHKLKYGIKTGRGASVYWIMYNSFLRESSMTAGNMIPMWFVPEDSAAANFIGGLRFEYNRFGNEHRVADDMECIIADEDTGSGTDFGSRNAHSTAASTNRMSGLKSRYNWARGSSSNALVTSYTSRLGGCHFENDLLGNMPGEIQFASGVTPDLSKTYRGTNIIDTSQSGMDVREPYVSLGDFAHLFRFRDTHGLYRGTLSAPSFAGSHDPYRKMFVEPKTGFDGNAGSPTITSITDPYGGTKASEIVFAGNDEFDFTNRVWQDQASGFTLASTDVGKSIYVDFKVARGSSNSLDHIGVSIQNSSSQVRWEQIVMLHSTEWADVSFQIPPLGETGNMTLSFHSYGWESGSKTTVKIGLISVYTAHSRQNTGHLAALDGTWDGPHLVLGNYHFWVDTSGKLRIKDGAPTSATDADVVGSQS